MLAEQRSREAYAREHGLSAKFMQAKVYWSRMMANTYRWQEAFNRIATFMVVEPPMFRGVFVGDNRANVVYTKLPDGKVAVDTVLKPEEAEVLSRLESKRSKVTTADENCQRCGHQMAEGACNYCEETPRCIGCGQVLIEYMRPPGDYCGDCLL